MTFQIGPRFMQQAVAKASIQYPYIWPNFESKKPHSAMQYGAQPPQPHSQRNKPTIRQFFDVQKIVQSTQPNPSVIARERVQINEPYILELSFTVRENVYEKIMKFKENSASHFSSASIKQFLITILHQQEKDVQYFINNMFRCDSNNDGIIQFDEFTDFLLGQHLGEISLQQFHKDKVYLKGAQYRMRGDEFLKTMRRALLYINFQLTTLYESQLFAAIHLDSQGFISYEYYFRFLKQCFGSNSIIAKLVNISLYNQNNQANSHNKHRDTKQEVAIIQTYSKYESNSIENQQNRSTISTNKPPNSSKVYPIYPRFSSV